MLLRGLEAFEETKMSAIDIAKALEDAIRSLEYEVKYQDSIILKQRKIIVLQSEILTKIADMGTDDTLVKAIKELQDEKQKIIKEE